MNRLADLDRGQRGDELAQLESLDNGKPVKLAKLVDVVGHGRAPAPLRRLGRADRRRGPARPPARHALLHAPGAGRGVRADHPVELPHADGGLEARPRPGRRLHRAAQAGRADAADRAADRRAGAGGRLPAPAWSTCSPATARPARRSSITPAWTRSPSPARPRWAARSAPRPGRALKRVTLELGGKSPNIILPDADLKAAIAGSFNGIYFNTGQACNAGSRLFVHRDQFDEVVSALAERAAGSRLGPGLEKGTQLGPVVSARAAGARARPTSSPGRSEGAELITGGDGGGRRRLLRRAHPVHHRARRPAHRARGDLRPGARRPALRVPRGGGRAGQRHRLRPRRGRVDARRRQRPPPRRAAQGGLGVRQLLGRGRSGRPVRRLQGLRDRARARPRRASTPTSRPRRSGPSCRRWALGRWARALGARAPARSGARARARAAPGLGARARRWALGPLGARPLRLGPGGWQRPGQSWPGERPAGQASGSGRRGRRTPRTRRRADELRSGDGPELSNLDEQTVRYRSVCSSTP